MILDKIKNPSDIKKLPLNEKKILSEEIRDIILKTVSENGGHLASNLGVVELTIALLSYLDLDKDKIIWDVGHQCYTYKLLTGRKDKFNTLRKTGGISGFPRSNESNYDFFDVGHSSTSISVALGMARAISIKKEKKKVVAIIGDGALTSGLAMEALNDAGISKTNLIVILNDNKMSISKNTGGLSQFLSHLRTRKTYVKLNSIIRKIVTNIPFIGKYLYKIVAYIKKRIKGLFIKNMYFENIGYTYLGPVNGHNISDMINILKSTNNIDGPILLHVITKKGKGYLKSELEPNKYHAVSPFDINKGLINKHNETYSDIVGNTLVKLAKNDKRIVAITAAMAEGTGLSNFKKHYPKRFYDVEICEEHALTMSSGMAKEGMIPFVAIYSTFIQRGYDEIIHDICLNDCHVVLLVDRAGNTGNDGETHHGIYDLSFLKTIPNLVIMAPKDAFELYLMIKFSINYHHPIAIRYPKGNIININENKKILLGKSEILKEGRDITILAVGKMVQRSLNISHKLSNDNIDAEVINIRFIKPFDYDTVIQSFNKTHLLVTIEDNDYEYGFAEIITKYINQDKVKSFGYPDTFISHGNISDLEKKYHLDEDSLYNEIIDFYQKNKQV